MGPAALPRVPLGNSGVDVTEVCLGTMTFGEVASASIKYARDGFSMHPTLQDSINNTQDQLRRWPANAAIYLPNDQVPEVGENFVQSDLGKTLQYLADEEASTPGNREEALEAARRAFYEGDIARAIVKYHEENDGLMTAEDLSDFRVGHEAPVMRNYKVAKGRHHFFGLRPQLASVLQPLACVTSSSTVIIPTRPRGTRPLVLAPGKKHRCRDKLPRQVTTQRPRTARAGATTGALLVPGSSTVVGDPPSAAAATRPARAPTT